MAELELERGHEGTGRVDFYIEKFNSTRKFKLQSLELLPFYYQVAKIKIPNLDRPCGESSVADRLCCAIVLTSDPAVPL